MFSQGAVGLLKEGSAQKSLRLLAPICCIYEYSFVCIFTDIFIVILLTVPQSVLMLCVAAYWPKQTYLTLSRGRPTEHIFSFSAKPCLLTRTVAHIYLVAAQLNHRFLFFSILGRWAAPLKQFGQCNRGDQEHQNSRWECFTHSVPPMRFFSSCVRTETSDLQSIFWLLWSLPSRRSLPHIWQRWY